MIVAVSVGLLILRIIAGLTMAVHGAEKTFGWFGGAGFSKTTQMMQSQRFKPALFWAALGSIGELGGGLSLALGFLTPLGAAAIVASMFMAVARFTWKRGFSASNKGFEYPLTHLAIALALGLTGPGNYALDAFSHLPFSAVGAFIVLAIIGILIDLIGMFISRPVTTAASQPAS